MHAYLMCTPSIIAIATIDDVFGTLSELINMFCPQRLGEVLAAY